MMPAVARTLFTFLLFFSLRWFVFLDLGRLFVCLSDQFIRARNDSFQRGDLDRSVGHGRGEWFAKNRRNFVRGGL